MRVKIKEVVNNYPDVLQITWVINTICSNKCNYCVPALHSGTNHGYEWETVKAFYEEIFKRHPKIHVSIAGGEPTMSPFLLELCKMIHEKGSTVGFTTNGTRNVEYFEEISKYVNYIVFSYHPQYGDKNNLLSKVNATIKNCNTSVRIMMSPTHWDNCVGFFNEIKNSEIRDYFNTEIVKVLDWDQKDRSTIEYTDEQLEYFNNEVRINAKILDYKNEEGKLGATFHLEDGTVDTKAEAIEYVNQGLADFSGYQCDIGLESLFIFADGTIKRGNCIGFVIGNINKLNEIKWPTKSVMCPWKICACATDVLISKRSPDLAIKEKYD